MKASLHQLLAAAALLSVGGRAAAQSITACEEADRAACASSLNRTCYKLATQTTECGYCLNGFFEHDGDCYNIEEIGTEGFLVMSKLLELYLPEYVDPDVSVAERALRLKGAAKIISFWDSQMPPPPFKLALNNETFLTNDERRGRLGISSALSYNPSSYLGIPGNRGDMGRIEYAFAGSVQKGSGNEEQGAVADLVDEEGVDGRARRLANQEDVPPYVDWDEEGYLTAIKNQGLCGCCWAVATAAVIEASMMLNGQTERYDPKGENSLSFQQMVSCDTDELGCGGGNILMAMRYVWEHNDFDNGKFGGLYSYKDYPYSDFFGETTTECQATAKKDSGTEPASYLNYPKVVNSVNDRSGFQERKERLMYAVSKQPVTTVMKSNCDLLMNYKEGVLTHDSGCECCNVDCIDHAIVIVGYDADAETPYWKLRNSWGEGWGEEGHFRVAMNDEGCGWGLFGVLAENGAPSDAYQSLEDLPERPGWWETAQPWEKALVLLLSILGLCCLCGCLVAARNRCKKSE